MSSYAIIAPDYDLALHYFQVHGISRRHWRYIASAGQLNGVLRDTPVLWLTHDQHGDFDYTDTAQWDHLYDRMQDLFDAGRIELRVIAFEDAPR